jgi:hypothetical protein
VLKSVNRVVTSYEAMNATNHPIAYAVCRTYDGAAWEVNIRTGNIDSALDDRYADQGAATAAGEAWLRQQAVRSGDNLDEIVLSERAPRT